MGEFKGSFLGFTFDNIHSSQLGIVRVSDGSRFSENLLPNIQDKTSQIPGSDGTYYFGSYYTQKQFSFPIAFDNLTEEQFRKMRQVFGDKGVHNLIFDETPYKVYTVKVTGNPSLKYVSFDKDLDEYEDDLRQKSDLYGGTYGTISNSDTIRIYKGEGTLNFTAYYPFAKSRYKFRDEYDSEAIPEWGHFNEMFDYPIAQNMSEWINELNLINSTYNSDTYTIDTPMSNGCLVYNPGDMPTPFKLKLMFNAVGGSVPAITLSMNGKSLSVEGFTLSAEEYGVQINTKLHLIEGLKLDGSVSGKVYNRYIVGGDFFDLDVTESPQLLTYSVTTTGTMTIDYNYLYY